VKIETRFFPPTGFMIIIWETERERNRDKKPLEIETDKPRIQYWIESSSNEIVFELNFQQLMLNLDKVKQNVQNNQQHFVFQ
jgi:hypothetical protein